MEVRDEVSVLVWAKNPDFAARSAFWLSGLRWRFAMFSYFRELENQDPETWACMFMEEQTGDFEKELAYLRSRWNWKHFPIFVFTPIKATAVSADQLVIRAEWPQSPLNLEKLVTSYLKSRQQADPASLRSSHRQFCNGPARVDFEIKVVDISESGAQLECPFKLPRGSDFRLDLSQIDPEMRTPLTFQVLGVRPCLPPKEAYRLHGLFKNLTPEQQRVLRRTIIKVQMSIQRKTNQVNFARV